MPSLRRPDRWGSSSSSSRSGISPSSTVLSRRWAKERAGALLVMGHPLFFLHRTRLADLAARNRLPSMSTQEQWVDAGGLMSYGPNFVDVYRRGAVYGDRILRGAKRGDLPTGQPTNPARVLNLKAAKRLGLTIPPSLLQRPDHVIE